MTHPGVPGMPPLPCPVLYRSAHFVVIDKPGGLAVHPGPQTRRSVEDFFPLLSRRKDGPWLVHRLDTDTSGCLLIALRKQPLIEAQSAFQNRTVRKIYRAIVHGRPQSDSGLIDAPLARRESRAGWKMIVDPDGQPARTRWRVLASASATSLLELELLTGRTHQARVHCAHLGCPILGDPVYGTGAPSEGLLHLQSHSLTLNLPNESIAAIAELPPHMERSARALGLAFQELRTRGT